MGMARALADVPAIDKGILWHQFGAEDHGWNLGEDGEGDGAPGRGLIWTALITFADCWGDYDAATAARIFNLPLALIEPFEVKPPFEADPRDVNVSDLGTTIQVLAGCRSHFADISVAAMAGLLNQSWVRIIEAVGGHCWMFVEGEGSDPEKLWIGHEGE